MQSPAEQQPGNEPVAGVDISAAAGVATGVVAGPAAGPAAGASDGRSTSAVLVHTGIAVITVAAEHAAEHGRLTVLPLHALM